MRVSLSGSTYQIEWRWNTRASFWSFSMYKPDGERLISGVPVLLNSDLLAWVPASLDRPPYRLLVTAPNGAQDEPTLTTLGRSIKVVYTGPDE
jgi:hypothetical protein